MDRAEADPGEPAQRDSGHRYRRRQRTDRRFSNPTSDAVLLVSGLSLGRANSFRRQLELLGRAFAARGVHSVLVGIGDASPPVEEEKQRYTVLGDVEILDARRLREMTEEYGLCGALLLGYEDQFAVLRESSETAVPLFLWAQVSSPPKRAAPPCTAVPLTKRSAAMLQEAGRRIGPIIPHAVDTEAFSPKLEYRDNNRSLVRFLSVGANTRRKRFDRLLEAFHRARRTLADNGVQSHLTIKTDRDRPHGGFDLSRKRSGDPAISICVGELSEEQMAALYRAHDVYVHAAEWEGFGVPAIEAMSCGLPVVSPRGQGPAEIVPYSDLLADCEPADPDQPESVCPVSVSSLAENMRKAGADRALCRILSRTGRKAAVEHYDADVVATHWLSVLGLSD
jgi:hypothetical protein